MKKNYKTNKKYYEKLKHKKNGKNSDYTAKFTILF